MLLPTSKTFTSTDFTLTGGATLEELTIAYETWGTLNANASNAILLCHGYTNFPHAGGGASGWFHNHLGPGKAVDTDKYFVVCSNMLGSAYGTTGPESINPKTGKPYGPDFPEYSTVDMVAAQERLIDHLGINQLKAVMGYSYGGHLTYRWGATNPDRMRALVPIAGVIQRKTSRDQIQAIKDRFAQNCPGWNGGWYYGKEKESGVFDEMIKMRVERLTIYGVGKHLEDTVSDPAERKAIIHKRAETWAGEFDANSLWVLYKAGVGSDVTPMAKNIKAPLLNVLARTDSVVDVALGQPTVDLLKGHGVDARFLEIDTEYGHAGPMIDAHLWTDKLAAFLEETP
ncbi:MAG: alpha/beta fold hydrolase [Rhodospirillaceae bacterium]